MTLYNVVVGDWSDDGHGKTDTFVFSIPDDVTFDQLRANYERNCEDYGVRPDKWASEWQDSSFPLHEYIRIAELGWDSGYEFDELDQFDDSTEVDFGSDSYADLLMFVATHGLCEYDQTSDTIKTLFGGDGAIVGGHVGYGFFW